MSTVLEPPPEQTQTPIPTLERSAPAEAPMPRSRGGLVGGLILIGLGAAALIGNVLPASGGLLFIGLGTAFLVARVVTGRYGYAVPAGLLLAFGAFVTLTETGLVVGRDAGGAFFVALGLGFVATYLIAAQPRAVWPIVPACALIGFGLFVQGWLLAWPFEQLLWLAPYWPVALIIFGGWLLLRDQVPISLRGPLTIVAVGGLILVGFVVAAAGMATVTAPAARFAPFPAWPVMPMFGAPPVQDSVVLTAPVRAGDIVRLSTVSGRTTLRAGAADQARVEAIRHYWTTSGAPQVALRPSPGALAVETQDLRGPGVGMSYVDYVVDVPPTAGADVRSTSGDVSVTGLQGPLAVRTTSGDIDLAGTFEGGGTVSSTSGDVTLRLQPGTSARIDVSTVSGTVRTSGPGLPAMRDSRNQVITVGSGAAQIQVRTTSGSIALLSP